MTSRAAPASDTGHRMMTAERFASLRDRLDMTIAQLAAELGMTAGEVKAMEAGTAAIDRRTTMAMQWLAVCQTGIVSRSWSLGPKRDAFGRVVVS